MRRMWRWEEAAAAAAVGAWARGAGSLPASAQCVCCVCGCVNACLAVAPLAGTKVHVCLGDAAPPTRQFHGTVSPVGGAVARAPPSLGQRGGIAQSCHWMIAVLRRTRPPQRMRRKTCGRDLSMSPCSSAWRPWRAHWLPWAPV